MKATVTGKDFAHGLELVAGALGHRSTVPILGTVHLEAARETEAFDRGVLILQATNGERIIRAEVPANVAEPGIRCVIGAKLTQVGKELAGVEELRLAGTSAFSIEIRSSTGRFSIPGLDASEFPQPKPGDTLATLGVKAESFAAAIDAVSCAISDDEARHALNGFRLIAEATRATLAATDGHRLIELSVPLERGPETATDEIIVPQGAVAGLLRLLKGQTDATVDLSSSYITVAVQGARISDRLIEGQFPNTASVINSTRGRDTVAVLVATDFARALRQAALMAAGRSEGVKLSFEAARLVLTAHSHDLGESEIEVPLTWLTKIPADPIAVGVNAGYVLDYLPLVAGEVHVSIKDALSPLLFTGRPTDDGKETAPFYVVMPLRM